MVKNDLGSVRAALLLGIDNTRQLIINLVSDSSIGGDIDLVLSYLNDLRAMLSSLGEIEYLIRRAEVSREDGMSLECQQFLDRLREKILENDSQVNLVEFNRMLGDM